METRRRPFVTSGAPQTLDPGRVARADPGSPRSPSFRPPGAPKRGAVLSWIFRHRGRLRQIYGDAPPPPLPGERFAPAGPRVVRTLRSAGPGELVRSRGATTMKPMPRRSA